MSVPTSKIGKRKRPGEDVEDPFSRQRTNDGNAQNPSIGSGGPLQGVIACLSGLAQDQKNDLHRLVLSLGGKYTRELNLDKNTHLITETANGAKYELAVSTNPSVIEIVTPSWLISTWKSGERASEVDHGLESARKNSEGNRTVATSSSSRTSAVHPNDALREALENGVDRDTDLSRSFLFEKLQFYLIGFEQNPELKQKISRLIRRGNGTIHWDLNDDVSILLVCDACDDALRKAAGVIATNHSNFPQMVSLLWVIDSYRHSALQSALDYPPAGEGSQQFNRSNDRIKPTEKGAKLLSKTTSLSCTTSKVSIFRGCLFSLARSSITIEQKESKQVTNTNVEFDSKELEALIEAHGGQTLSAKLLGALHADGKGTNGQTTRRKCYVVCWGESPTRLETNPLVSQLERLDLCEIILVTPIWVKACVSSRKRIRSDRMPLALTPQSWPMKSALDGITELSNNPRRRKLQIAVTGFQGTEKVVLVHLIDAIGGVYRDNMSNANTHLIYKKNPSGLKLEKAIEWGLHVVSVEWLYHILRYGYGGGYNDELGCEKRFSFEGS